MCDTCVTGDRVELTRGYARKTLSVSRNFFFYLIAQTITTIIIKFLNIPKQSTEYVSTHYNPRITYNKLAVHYLLLWLTNTNMHCDR